MGYRVSAHVPKLIPQVNTAEELCFFPIDNRRRGRQSVESLRVKIDETAAEASLESTVAAVDAGLHKIMTFVPHDLHSEVCWARPVLVEPRRSVQLASCQRRFPSTGFATSRFLASICLQCTLGR